MQSAIVVYTLKGEDGSVYACNEAAFTVFGVTAEQMQAQCGDRFRREEIVLKEPLTYAMQQEVERAVYPVQANGQIVRDETKRPGAMVGQYVASWTFMTDKGEAIPATAEGFGQLHPNVAGVVDAQMNARIFPGLAASPDFFTILSSGRDGSASPPRVAPVSPPPT